MFESKETDALVVGAGPVGLFTALLLSQRGVDVQVFDRNLRTTSRSYALALHPRTLDLMDEIGIAPDLIPHGRKVTHVRYFDGRDAKAELDFRKLDTRFPFLLVLPQSALEIALEEKLREHKVRIHWNHRVQGIDIEEDSASIDVARLSKESMGYPIAREEWIVTKMLKRTAPFLIGADGYDSRVRAAAEIDYVKYAEPQHFAVFEYFAPKAEDDDVRVIFHEGHTNVYWPLPNDLRRLSFQIDEPMHEMIGMEHLCHFISERVGWDIPVPGELRWASQVSFDRRLANQFSRGPVLLAGDACHLTGPLGVQSMNVGLFEAHEIAWRIAQILKAAAPRSLVEDYDQKRQQEWRRLLELDVKVAGDVGTDPWVTQYADRVLATLPGSGDQLDLLLAQLGLHMQSHAAGTTA